MRILIVGTIQGDSGYEEEYLVKNIEKYLITKGHIVDNFMLPYTRDMLALPDQIFAYQLLDTSSADMLITVGYPACTLKHNNKIVYLLEMAPMLHEYWDSEYGVLANAQYSKMFAAINDLECQALKESTKIVCNSQILCDDIYKRYTIESELQYYPNIFDISSNKIIKDNLYYICETSLLPYHRIELLLDTIKEMKDTKWYIYIPKANPVYLETLEKQIDERQIKEEVIVSNGIIPDNLIRNAVAYFAPDYKVRKVPGGIVRCAALGTPIITCEDSGAISEYITLYNCGSSAKAVANILSKKLYQLASNGNPKTKKQGNIESFMRGLTTL